LLLVRPSLADVSTISKARAHPATVAMAEEAAAGSDRHAQDDVGTHGDHRATGRARSIAGQVVERAG